MMCLEQCSVVPGKELWFRFKTLYITCQSTDWDILTSTNGNESLCKPHHAFSWNLIWEAGRFKESALWRKIMHQLLLELNLNSRYFYLLEYYFIVLLAAVTRNMFNSDIFYQLLSVAPLCSSILKSRGFGCFLDLYLFRWILLPCYLGYWLIG